MARFDAYSAYDPSHPTPERLEFDLSVDFRSRRLSGTAALCFREPVAGDLHLDTRDLEIGEVRTGDGEPVPWSLEESDPIQGSPLSLRLPPDTRRVVIRYRTSPECSALQWLAPQQTGGKRHPFVFSQCQAIHARSLAPLQDTPRVRTAYEARLSIPEDLDAVMSAETVSREEGPEPGTRRIRFRMPQPIPSYLLALAVGKLESRDLSPRCRIYAEGDRIEAGAWEFAEVEEMIRAGEDLFGPYDWDRYDMLILPPSFPYGGMENPRLSFFTPTILAGDRSLADVVAHELAHSWTGNLVTNATWDHIWLNEGFTVWAERRIIEAMQGPEAAARLFAAGRALLDGDLARFGSDSPLTRLRLELRGEENLEDAVSYIPYEKGVRFVVRLERELGRGIFDRFVKSYMERFRFTSITTEEFTSFLRESFPDIGERVDLKRWLYDPGLPEDAPAFRSDGLAEVERWSAAWVRGERPPAEVTDAWTPRDLLVFLCGLPRRIEEEECAWLDERFALNAQANFEVLGEWLNIAAASGYEPAFGRIRDVLEGVGRLKFLMPLYQALGASAPTRALARECLANARHFYHGTALRIVEEIVAAYPG